MPDPTVPAVSSTVQAALSEALQVLVAAVGTIKTLPQNLPTPDRPVVLTGTLLPLETDADSSDPQSLLTTIQTALGDLTIALDKAVAAGPVTIQIQPGTPPTAAVLVAVSAAAQPTVSSSQATALEPNTELLPAAPAVILPAAPVVAPAAPLVGQIIQTLFIPAPAGTVARPPLAAAPVPLTPSANPPPISTSLLAQAAASETVPAQTPAVAIQALPQAFQILAIRTDVPPPAATIPVVSPPLAETSGLVVLPATLAPAATTAASPILPPQPPALSPAPLPTTAQPPSAAASASPPAAQPATATVLANPPGPPASNTGAVLPPPVTATVIASTTAQQPVLAVPTGTLVVNQPLAVSPGQTLILRPLTVQQAGQLNSSFPTLASPGHGAWPALAEGLAMLGDTPAAQSLVRFIPTLDQDFVAGLVAYLTKETGSDKQANLETSTIIHDLKVLASLPGLHATLGQLQSEALGRGSPAVASQNWHSYPVPFQTDSGLSLIQVYVRQQREQQQEGEEQQADRQNTTRFLLEVHPSQLGPVQLDGLVRQGIEAALGQTHLDLIVRSEALIPPEDAAELQGLFIQSLESTGLTGRLSFQEGRNSFVQAEESAGMRVQV